MINSIRILVKSLFMNGKKASLKKIMAEEALLKIQIIAKEMAIKEVLD